MFKTKTGYYLDFLTPETMRLLGSTKSKIKIKMLKICLIQKLLKKCQYIIIFLTTFINKIRESCVHLYLVNRFLNCEIFLQKNLSFFKKYSLKLLYIEVWLTDQSSKPLEIKDKINTNIVIN